MTTSRKILNMMEVYKLPLSLDKLVYLMICEYPKISPNDVRVSVTSLINGGHIVLKNNWDLELPVEPLGD